MNREQIKQSAVALITKALPNRMEDMPGLLTNITTIQSVTGRAE